ncbi:hypothetical protein ACHAWX_000945 [Stephanocyclus meneghinianus]
MISSILAASRMSLFRDSRPTAAFALAGHKSISTRSTHRDVFDTAGIPSTETCNDKGIVAHENSDIGDQAIGDSGSKTWQNPRSRWARRKHRKKMEKRLLHDPAEEEENDNRETLLNWESFEFGNSPKMDKRFTTNNSNNNDPSGIPQEAINTIPTDSITYQTYLQSESNLDRLTSQRLFQSHSQLLSLSPHTVQRSIDILSPYVQPRRLQRIQQVLSKRTRHARFLFENPSNPSNVWACLRTLDSFGIQYVDVIVDSEEYAGKAAVNQKRGMRTAMGSACWMTLRQFGSTEEAISVLRDQEKCLIYASDLNPESMDVRDLKWDVNYDLKDDVDNIHNNDNNNNALKANQRPICIVMGNEERGISDKMRRLADGTFYLPMCGFAESFNLSVATAITLAYMSAASGRGNNDGEEMIDMMGPLRPGDLDPHEMQCLKLKGVLNSLAQKRMGKALLKKEGIVLPNSIYN